MRTFSQRLYAREQLRLATYKVNENGVAFGVHSIRLARIALLLCVARFVGVMGAAGHSRGHRHNDFAEGSREPGGDTASLQAERVLVLRKLQLRGTGLWSMFVEDEVALAEETYPHPFLPAAGAACKNARDLGRYIPAERRMDCGYSLPCLESKSSHSQRPQTIIYRVLQVDSR